MTKSLSCPEPLKDDVLRLIPQLLRVLAEHGTDWITIVV